MIFLSNFSMSQDTVMEDETTVLLLNFTDIVVDQYLFQQEDFAYCVKHRYLIKCD